MFHEQHVALVGDLGVLHCMWIQGQAGVDFCLEDVSCLGLAQQEALDAPSDQLVMFVQLEGKAVLGGNHALVKAWWGLY